MSGYMRRAWIVVVAVTAAAALSGCGALGRPAPTLAQFASQANRICLRLSVEQAPRAAELEQLARLDVREAQLAVPWREIQAVSYVADRDVSELPRPPDQASVIARLVAGYFKEASNEADLVAALTAENRAAVTSLRQTNFDLATRNAEVARGLGMTDCAKAAPEKVPSQRQPV
jgi:hypothetical protein